MLHACPGRGWIMMSYIFISTSSVLTQTVYFVTACSELFTCQPWLQLVGVANTFYIGLPLYRLPRVQHAEYWNEALKYSNMSQEERLHHWQCQEASLLHVGYRSTPWDPSLPEVYWAPHQEAPLNSQDCPGLQDGPALPVCVCVCVCMCVPVCLPVFDHS